MYRNIYYDNSKGMIKLWTWNDQGERIESLYPFKPYIYLESQSTNDATSLYNTQLRKKEFKNQFERRRFINECGIKRIFYNIPCEQQFLIEQYGTLNTTPEFSKFPLKMFYLDIETYSPDEFPDIDKANDPINVITYYDTIDKKFYTWGLDKEYTGKNDRLVYTNCETETDLLKGFIDKWSSDYPDIVAGWNSEGFDIPYLMARINRILGEDYANQLSPVHQVYLREDVVKRFGKVEKKWYIRGVCLIDYLEAYKVFSKSPRESYALNAIGEIELGEGKLAFNAVGLSELSDNDWNTFIDYNIQDVNILVKLEEKLKFLEICRMLGYFGLTNFESAMGTIGVMTGAIAVKAKERGLIIPTFETENRVTYEGGYVKEPERGIKSNIISFDANSLYPNTIITLNISPETKVGKILSSDENQTLVKLVNGNEYTLKNDIFKQFIKKENIAVSKANVLYSQKVKGICPELVEWIYGRRVKDKNEMKVLKKHKNATESKLKTARNKNEIDKVEILKKQSKEIETQIVKKDIIQFTLKILANRLYGFFANKHSHFCDIDAASSITLTGQECIKQANLIINNYAQQKYDVNNDLNIYNDTDSVAGSTLIRTNQGIIPIEQLYNEYSKNNKTTLSKYGHETIIPKDLECLTYDSSNKEVKLAKIKRLIRHKTNKKLYKIKINGKEIITTEDHSIMVERDGNLVQMSPKDIKVGDKVINIYKVLWVIKYEISQIETIECLGECNSYVYDIEMDDDTEHTFFANDILVHNSTYFTIKPILDKQNIPLLIEGKINPKVYEIAKDLQNELNSKITTWARNELYSADPRFEFKRETICDAGIFIEKKRYILHILDEEDIPEDKVKYVGVEVVSTGTPKQIKPLIKNIVECILKSKDEKIASEMFYKTYEQFQKMKIEELAFPRGIKKLENYSQRSSGFSTPKGTPCHVKAAYYHNLLLDKLGLGKKYEKLKSGIKIKFFYTKPNRYDIKVIAFLDKFPEEFQIEIDKDEMFDKTIKASIDRLFTAIGWKLKDPKAQETTDLFNLLS